MLVQAACLTMPRFCHTSKNVSGTGTAAFWEINYRCGMRSREDDSLKSGMAWRTSERKIHEHTSWCVMHTLLTQEEKVLLPLHAATHIVIHTHTLSWISVTRSVLLITCRNQKLLSRTDEKRKSFLPQRPGQTRTHKPSAHKRQRLKEELQHKHTSHTTYSKLQTDV